MVLNTTILALSGLVGEDICAQIDSYRPLLRPKRRVRGEPKLVIDRVQKRWIAIYKKRKVFNRDDVWLSPFPQTRHLRDGVWIYEDYMHAVFVWFRATYGT